MRVMHFDRIDLRLDASTKKTLPGGGVMVDGIAARTGLYTYHDAKGDPFVELVPASTLFDQASMDSMAGAAFTIRHPDGLVTPDKFQTVTHGAVVKAWQASDSELGVRVKIGSEDGLKALADGMIELSPGYEVDVSDDPGSSGFGRHDGVQEDRLYDHLSGLWAGEARGGSGMRLHVDGRTCAPTGCRVQFSRHTRADARQETMSKKITITHKDGRKATVDAGLLGWLKSAATSATSAKSKNTDQIEMTTLTWVAGEGEEETMTIPSTMFESMLEGLGVSAGAPAAEPAGMEEEVIQEEGLDADDEDPKMDSKGIKALVSRLTVDAYAKAHRAQRKLDRQVDARDAEVVKAAGKLHVDASDGRHWTQVALDGIAKADPTKAAAAKKLAGDAKAGDQVAEGRLRQMLADAAATASADGTSSMVEGEHVEHTRPKSDAKDQPWGKHSPKAKETT